MPPIGYIIILIVLGLLLSAAFRPLRDRSQLSDAEDKADLAETDRRIAEIEREADRR